jgi:thiol:disulfide interchange protein DsbD
MAKLKFGVWGGELGLGAALQAAVCVPLLLALPAAGAVDLDPLANVVHADLLAEQDAVVPGASITLGLRLRHAPHWHTYWVIPGDAGLPTQLRWTLPPGYVAGPLLWPAPQRLSVGSLANYGYEGEVLLPIVIQVPAGAQPGSTAHFAAHADWLVCNDLCIPGGADLALNLPVRNLAEVRPGAEAALFTAARQQLPQPLARGLAQASREATRVRLELQGAAPVRRALEFFPLEAGRIVAAAEQKLTLTGPDRVRLDLTPVAPAEPGFTKLRGVLVADGGPGAGGWLASIDLPLRGAAAAAPSSSAAAGNGSAPTATAPSGALPSSGAATTGGATVPPESATQAALADRTSIARTAPDSIPIPPPAGPGAAGGVSVVTGLTALAGAFLGGLILNLMPCVFPVLSLKLMALVQHRGETRARLRGHGIAFTFGVVLSFLALAGLLLVLREAGSQIGWGFQLQSPLVIGALTGLFFLIGLNLLGTFEFTLGAGLANSAAAQALDGESGPGGDGGLRGSFATGVLAAVIASPCTAPFMGAALGFAVTQSAPIALLVFAALGAGMAAPYLALTFFPAWLQRLPRPGAWMERLKQFMAFPMFLTCVWLFWVLGLQIGMDGAAWMLAALVGLALFAWSAGLAQRGASGFRWLAGAAAVVAALALLPLARSAAHTAPTARAEGGWSGWSPLAQRAALAAGRPVFVDFTAAWCITCQANRRLVLGDEKVERALRAGGVVLMEADWTRRDEAISRELNRFGRSGVPMYVLYDRAGVPHLLPEILSTEGLLNALASL